MTMGMPDYMKFPLSEYQERHNRVRELIEKKGLKGLLIMEGTNFQYFSGGSRRMDYSRPTFMLLPLKGKPIVLAHKFPDENRRREIWVDDIRFYQTMQGTPFDMVVEAMKDAGLNEGRVGAELGFEQRLGISLIDFMKLKELLPKVEFVDAADVFWGIRMIKSKEEIDRVRKSCEITVQAYNALFPILHEGMSEREIMDKFLKLQVEFGGSAPWGLMNSGPENYFCTGHGRPSTRRIQKGNQVWIDGGCRYRDYGCDFCCAGTVGPPSDKQLKAQEMVVGITNTVIDATSPGMKACDIDAINTAEWKKYGHDYSKIDFGGGRIGHGMGLLGTEPPHIGPEDTTVIKPGMIFTIEPGMPTEYGCFQAETNVVVTEDGCEVLNKMDWNLRIISTT
jgi:Xaa-Pro aminopeptidase